MKKLLAILLVAALAMTGCTMRSNSGDSDVITTTQSIISSYESDSIIQTREKESEYVEQLNFTSLSDPNLMRYFEDSVYSDLVARFDSEDYFVENVSTKYISKEYIEELEYNSQENIYFGYTLSELDEQFQGKRYVFTLGEDGQTTVKEFEEFSYDFDFNKVIKNVAIGGGVILVCVTVSVLPVGPASAVSIVFATSAEEAKIWALSEAVISGASSAIVKGIQTGDFEEALLAGISDGSEGFKWGAISGALIGGAGEAINVLALKGADVTANGLTLKEASMIQKESKYPLDVIKQFKSFDEYNVYKTAGLKAKIINGKTALIPDIDLDFKSLLPDGSEVTNLQRILDGLAPIDPITGKAYQLHHIGQKAEGTLAVLTELQHQGNSKILNTIGKESEIDRAAFDKIRKAFWKDVGTQIKLGMI